MTAQRAFVAGLAAAMLSGLAVAAGPDVVIGEVSLARKWGSAAGLTGYTFSHTFCNRGDQTVDVFQASPSHPVITASVYRLMDGRLEQIGQGFAFHEYCVLQGSFCATCNAVPTGCVALGAGCSTNTSQINAGIQGRLGFRRDINPATGVFAWPLAGLGDEGDALFKRVQIANSDLDPAMNPGAVYFVESRVLEPDDAQSGNGMNNATCRPIQVGALDNGGYVISMAGAAIPEISAVEQWAMLDSSVLVSVIDFGVGERVLLGSKATDNGDGTFTYEYAIENYSSVQAIGSIRVGLSGATAGGAGFHDLAYHSGDMSDGTDWPATIDGADAIEWKTHETWAQNPDGNSIRWGTTYNFRFVANSAPEEGSVSIGFFAPGALASVEGIGFVPSAVPACQGDADGDGDIDFGDVTAVLASWGSAGPMGDADHDGDVEFSDVTVVLAQFGGGC